jgi:Spy/CpxP family protein refolding chaperone
MKAVMVVVVLGVWAVFATFPSGATQQASEKVKSRLAERVQDLDLTDAQETKIAEIRKESRTKVQEAAKELAAMVKQEVGKIMDVLTPEQKKKLENVKEERAEFRGERLGERIAHLKELDLTDSELAKIKEIHKDCHAKTVKAMQTLEGLLTEEQKNARVKGLDAGMKRIDIIASLNLKGEQKDKVQAVGKEVRAFVHDELVKMRDVLSEGQKEKLQGFKDERSEHVRDRLAYTIANYKDLNLTDNQREKITTIRNEFRPKVQEAGNRLRATIHEEMEAIISAIKN